MTLSRLRTVLLVALVLVATSIGGGALLLRPPSTWRPSLKGWAPGCPNWEVTWHTYPEGRVSIVEGLGEYLKVEGSQAKLPPGKHDPRRILLPTGHVKVHRTLVTEDSLYLLTGLSEDQAEGALALVSVDPVTLGAREIQQLPLAWVQGVRYAVDLIAELDPGHVLLTQYQNSDPSSEAGRATLWVADMSTGRSTPVGELAMSQYGYRGAEGWVPWGADQWLLRDGDSFEGPGRYWVFDPRSRQFAELESTPQPRSSGGYWWDAQRATAGTSWYARGMEESIGEPGAALVVLHHPPASRQYPPWLRTLHRHLHHRLATRLPAFFDEQPAMADAALAWESPTGPPVTPLPDEFVRSLAHQYDSEDGPDARLFALDGESILLAQAVLPQERTVISPEGIVRLGVIDPANASVEWQGYFDLPKGARERTEGVSRAILLRAQPEGWLVTLWFEGGHGMWTFVPYPEDWPFTGGLGALGPRSTVQRIDERIPAG